MIFESVLIAGACMAVLLWAALSAYVLHVDRRRRSTRTTLASILETLRQDGGEAKSVTDRLSRVRPALERVSRDMALHAAADPTTPVDAANVLIAWLVEGEGLARLVSDASAHRRSRDAWRRAAALAVLQRMRYPATLDLLQRALEDADVEVSAAALNLLGASSEPRAVDILVAALHGRRHPASRVAVQLEHSPVRPAETFRELLRSPDPTVRLWAAALLGDYPDCAWVEAALAPLVDDEDPRVRKSAIQSLGRVGGELAGSLALRLLGDRVSFVRAHAARTLGELERSDAAAAVVALLGDTDWWVRTAAKQALENMGAEVWPVLMRSLDHRDAFVRNGAAEVFQNIGVLDSLIVMEAVTDNPSPSKIDLLRRIATAGGARLTDSLLERSGAAAPRIRRLLDSIGMEQVGVA